MLSWAHCLTTNIKLHPCICLSPSPCSRAHRQHVPVFVCVSTNAKSVCPVRGGHVANRKVLTKSLFSKQCAGTANTWLIEIICLEGIMETKWDREWERLDKKINSQNVFRTTLWTAYLSQGNVSYNFLLLILSELKPYLNRDTVLAHIRHVSVFVPNIRLKAMWSTRDITVLLFNKFFNELWIEAIRKRPKSQRVLMWVHPVAAVTFRLQRAQSQKH